MLITMVQSPASYLIHTPRFNVLFLGQWYTWGCSLRLHSLCSGGGGWRRGKEEGKKKGEEGEKGRVREKGRGRGEEEGWWARGTRVSEERGGGGGEDRERGGGNHIHTHKYKTDFRLTRLNQRLQFQHINQETVGIKSFTLLLIKACSLIHGYLCWMNTHLSFSLQPLHLQACKQSQHLRLSGRREKEGRERWREKGGRGKRSMNHGCT